MEYNVSSKVTTIYKVGLMYECTLKFALEYTLHLIMNFWMTLNKESSCFEYIENKLSVPILVNHTAEIFDSPEIQLTVNKHFVKKINGFESYP